MKPTEPDGLPESGAQAMKWKRFEIEWDGLDRNAPDRTLELLEKVSADGFEPKFLHRWNRHSMADPCGVTIFAKKCER